MNVDQCIAFLSDLAGGWPEKQQEAWKIALRGIPPERLERAAMAIGRKWKSGSLRVGAFLEAVEEVRGDASVGINPKRVRIVCPYCAAAIRGDESPELHGCDPERLEYFSRFPGARQAQGLALTRGEEVAVGDAPPLERPEPLPLVVKGRRATSSRNRRDPMAVVEDLAREKTVAAIAPDAEGDEVGTPAPEPDAAGSAR